MSPSRRLQVRLALCVLFCWALPGASFGQTGNSYLDRHPEMVSFEAGFDLLQQGAPFKKVLEQWETTLARYPNVYFPAPLKDYIDTLRKQIAQPADLPALPKGGPEALPLDQRIRYYAGQLPDAVGFQGTNPGTCYATGCLPCQALIKIGRPAVSVLIQHLEDRRLTRAVGHPSLLSNKVLLVQDVALQCLNEILGLKFGSEYEYYLSDSAPAGRANITAEIRAWWERNKDKTPHAGYRDRLDALVRNHASIYARVEVLERIEAIDRHAIDSVALLKSWKANVMDGLDDYPVFEVDNQKQEARACYARALAQRGDRSQLPAMREMLNHPNNEMLYMAVKEAVWCVLKLGTDADYRWLHQHIKSEAERLKKSGLNSHCDEVCREILVAPDDEWGLPAIRDRRLIPLLVEMLDNRQAPNENTLSEAEVAMNGLILLTGHSAGYNEDDPRPKRDAAIDRWIAWWRKTHHPD